MSQALLWMPRLIASLMWALAATGSAQAAQTATDPTPAMGNGPAGDGRNVWLDRPWELRYFLYVTEGWDIKNERALRNNGKAPSLGSLDRDWEGIVDPQHAMPFVNRWGRAGKLSVVLMEFEPNGRVKTPHRFEGPLWGRMDWIRYIGLGAGAFHTHPRFHLGQWFMGIGEQSTHWAPSLCPGNQMPSPFSDTDTTYLYGPKHEQSRFSPSVGCREWAYQLDEPGRPYIDITSYLPKRVDPKGPGTYVRDTIGWARFDSAVKPVIGKHENDWFCFHDCPDGQAPGRIADIAVWAAKQGWPTPKRPTRSPVFPDPPAQAGTYPQ